MKNHQENGPKRELDVDLRRTAIASLVATVALTGVANTEMPGFAESVARGGGVELDVGLQEVGPISLPGVRMDSSESLSSENTSNTDYPASILQTGVKTTPAGSRLTTVSDAHFIQRTTPTSEKNSAHDVSMEWARLFSQDPEAEKVTEMESIDALVGQLESLTDQGYSITSVRLQGYASMEDDTPDTHPHLNNPGFGIHSPKNVELAETRALAVGEILEDKLQDSIQQPIELEFMNGVELEDPQLASEITQYAIDHGYDLVALVKEYNRNPDNLPADAVELLNGLRDDRFVRVYIEAVKPGNSERVSLRSEEQVEVRVPGSSSEQTEEVDGNAEGNDSENDSRNISGSIVLIPALIPVFRRRRKEDEEPFTPGTGSTTPLPTKTILPPPITVLPPQPPPPPPPTRRAKTGLDRDEVQSKVGGQSYIADVRHRRIQPRNHNFHKTPEGRMNRSKGGNRSTKRAA